LTGAPSSESQGGDMAALAKGGRTSFVGFLLRLAARLPFLFIAGRLYGPEALGRFASALVVVELTVLAASHPAAAGRVLLARDDPDLSTPQLIRALAAGLGKPARLFPMPDAVWPLLRRSPKIGPAVQRLTASLQVDDSDMRSALEWAPPVSAEEGLLRTARAFRAV